MHVTVQAGRVDGRGVAMSPARASERDAFDDLVLRHQGQLLRFLYGLVQDRQLAADLCQDTFLAAFRALPRPWTGDERQLEAWLYTVALNRARATFRRRRLLRWVSFVVGAHDRPDEGADFGARLALREELRAVLDRLPVDQRACLLLHADGYRYGEIAEVLGCSVAAVKVRMFRARRRCLALFEEGR
jgi:RNA polymerase sigma-70 factor, ECF subfamily